MTLEELNKIKPETIINVYHINSTMFSEYQMEHFGVSEDLIEKKTALIQNDRDGDRILCIIESGDVDTIAYSKIQYYYLKPEEGMQHLLRTYCEYASKLTKEYHEAYDKLKRNFDKVKEQANENGQIELGRQIELEPLTQ